MNSKTKEAGIVVLSEFVMFLLATTVKAEESKIEQFARKYKQAKPRDARRDVIIAAIDQKCIDQFESVDVIKRICGTDFHYETQNEDSSGRGRVYFGPIEKGREGAPDYYKGWFMVVHFNRNGKIGDYYLSNVIKPVRYIEPH
jgi:hypothetical protein